MGDKYDEAFQEIVFCVTRLVFGNAQSVRTVYQTIIRYALLHLGVWEIIKGLRD